jgi:vacuolar-type H+-ATPase subunit H
MIFEYESRGYNVEVLDNALTLGLEDMKRILDDFESKAKRLENVKDRFAKLDIVGFEDEAEELITYLTDVSYVDDAEKRLGEFERKVTEKANKHKSKIIKKNEQRGKKMQKEIIDGKKLMKLAIKGKK